MARYEDYAERVQLLVDVLPYVAREDCFGLKGGTAINLFVRDMPRLSVDIDLAFLPIAPRLESIAGAQAALKRIAAETAARLANVRTRQDINREDALRIVVERGRASIKVEVSPVLRGTLHPPESRDITAAAEAQFGFASIPVLTLPDLYGGKLCAALDRQHPRDWFDVMLLLDAGELTREVFEGFLLYLISHGRPMNELLAGRWKPMAETFRDHFVGMTRDPIKVGKLEETRERLITRLRELMTDQDKALLLSLKSGQPDWSLFSHKRISELPAVQWKLVNIRKMKADLRRQTQRKLEAVLEEYGSK